MLQNNNTDVWKWRALIQTVQQNNCNLIEVEQFYIQEWGKTAVSTCTKLI